MFDNLLGRFHPLVAYVVANEKGQFSAPVVREAALLALCRYMAVSHALCEQVYYSCDASRNTLRLLESSSPPATRPSSPHIALLTPS